MPELEAAGVEPAAGSPRPSPYQPLTWEVRPEREHSVAHLWTPWGIAAFAANAPPEFVKAATVAACEAWEA